ncbi:MAG: ABC transporter ATP-binding protein [Gammaproteobacteria bacterium]|nr:ABC transporter ATP-binding protein [Gammaproteobacteria bacterium]
MDTIDKRALMRLLTRFWPLLKQHRKALAGAIACMFMVTAMELLRPWPLKIVFDGILMPIDTPGVVVEQARAWLPDADLLLLAVALTILVIALLGGLFGFGQSYLLSSVGQRTVAEIRRMLYAHIQRLSHSFHDERSLGDLLARLSGDVRMMRELLVNVAIYVSARVLLIFATVAVMLMMDWVLALAALSVLPPLMLLTRRFGGEIKGAARRQRRKESRISDVMAERIASIRLVQAYAREAYEDERFSRYNASSAQAGLRATRLEAHLDRWVQIVLATGTALVITLGVYRVRSGAITPGDLLVFTAYLSALFKPVRRLAAMTGRLAKAVVCGERVLAILDLEPEIRDAPDARAVERVHGAIAFEQLSFGYRAGRPVLDGIELQVAAGETVAIVGASGQGKSTLANLLLRFYDPQAGTIRVDGEDIRLYTLESLRSQMAVVLQEGGIFNTSIRDNIRYGALDASDEAVETAARLANAHEFIDRLPDGYDTVVGERGAQLSGGQRQRIAIARALVRDAPIVILDEPTASLDRVAADAVIDALVPLVRRSTCLMITHDPRLAAIADRVVEVRDGRVVEIPAKPSTFGEKIDDDSAEAGAGGGLAGKGASRPAATVHVLPTRGGNA